VGCPGNSVRVVCLYDIGYRRGNGIFLGVRIIKLWWLLGLGPCRECLYLSRGSFWLPRYTCSSYLKIQGTRISPLHFWYCLSNVLVWYSSFLNRSGILGDTSVHSFTDLGMFWQLVTGILIFLVMSVWLLVSRWKALPITQKDEETYSREFWMFVGAVFLGLSCFHLIMVTSIPVGNAIFGWKIAPPADKARLLHYNIFQSCFAFVITILTAVTQFLKYKKTDVTRFFITTAVYLFLAALIAALIVYVTGLYKLHFVFVLLMWGSVYSVLANGKVLADAFKGKLKLAGSAVAHIGFGMLLIGALISAGTSSVISINNTGESYSADFAKTENPRENILVYRNEPQKMGDYTVTYLGDSLALPDHFYKVNYRKVDANGKVDEDFTLFPKVQVNKGALASSPDTRHYLLHDLYTHITMTNSASTAEEKGNGTDGSDQPADDSKDYDAPVPHEVADRRYHPVPRRIYGVTETK
jgi:cytochrome c-type biogenesis protein CcmF